MRVLIACEFSGVVRRAFRARGHDAWSCDLLPAEDDSPFHFQRFAQDVIRQGGWDLLIAHPPCTYLCNSGVRWLSQDGKLVKQRHASMREAADLFAALYHAPIARVAIENPVMHKYARDYLQSAWKVPAFTQSIQPWQYGHGETKRTCLWLRGLPLLQATHRKGDLFCEPEPVGREARIHRLPPSEDRAKLRSITYAGIAEAMAEQWGNFSPH